METAIERAALTRRQAAFSLAGALTVTLGAALVVVGVFLPYAVSPDPRVELVDASVFASGPGIGALAGAGTALALALGRWRGAPMPWAIPSMIGLIGVAVVGLWFADVAELSLYQLAYRGPYHAATAELEPGAGIWLVGAGALTITLGGCCFAAVPMALQRALAAPAPAVAETPERSAAAPSRTAPERRTGPAWEDAREAPVGRWAPPVAPGSLPPWDDSTTPTSR